MLVNNRLKMFFEVVNVHDAFPKKEYMITAECDRQVALFLIEKRSLSHSDMLPKISFSSNG